MSWKELAYKDEVATLSDVAPVDVDKSAADAGVAGEASRQDHKHAISLALDELGVPTGGVDLNQQQADGLVLETATTGPDAGAEVAGQVYFNSTDKAVYVWVPS